MIARGLLPASPSYLLDRQDRAITSARPRSVSRHVGRTRRRNHDGGATRTGGGNTCWFVPVRSAYSVHPRPRGEHVLHENHDYTRSGPMDLLRHRVAPASLSRRIWSGSRRSVGDGPVQRPNVAGRRVVNGQSRHRVRRAARRSTAGGSTLAAWNRPTSSACASSSRRTAA